MRTFLNEALTMREFRHQHVLRLIGIVIDCDKMPLVILPFMSHGDLLSYIRDDNNVSSIIYTVLFAIPRQFDEAAKLRLERRQFHPIFIHKR